MACKDQFSHRKKLETLVDGIKSGIYNSGINIAKYHLPPGTTREIFYWKDSATSLNLLQLCILHCQIDLGKHIIYQHRSFLCTCLYLTPSHIDEQRSQCSQLKANDRQNETVSLKPDSSPKAELLNHPLHLACLLGNRKIVQHILKCISDNDDGNMFSNQTTYACSEKRPLAFYCICCNRRLEWKVLMASTSLINIESSAKLLTSQGLPLELALKSGNTSSVRALMLMLMMKYHHFFINCQLSVKLIPLHVACCLSCPDAVALLLQSLPKENLNAPGPHGHTLMHIAVWNGDTATIRLLLENGANVNARISSGASCFHVLYRSGLQIYNCEANTKLLLEYGADVRQPACDAAANSRQLSPLHVLVDVFVEDARIGKHHYQSESPWKKYSDSQWANKQKEYNSQVTKSPVGHLKMLQNCIRLLLEAGADPNAVCDEPDFFGKDCLTVILEAALNTNTLTTEGDDCLLQTTVEMFFEFGAKITCCLYPLLAGLKQLPHDAQAWLICALCKNGVAGSDICNCILGHDSRKSCVGCCFYHSDPSMESKLPSANRHSRVQDDSRVLVRPLCIFGWHQSALEALLNWTPLNEIKKCEELFSTTDVNNPSHLVLCGSPVRSLRHSCKLVVLKQMKHQQDIAMKLPLLLREFLKADYF